MTSRASRVAVVGGGVSGMTAAYRLRTLLGPDAELTVFESAGALGGKLRTAELAGVPYDVGAEAFLARRPEALALVREVGLGDVLTHPTKARPTIRAGGEAVTMPAGTVMGLPASAEAVAGVLSEDGLRAVAAEESLPPLRLPDDDVPLGPLLRDRFGDELVDRLVDPLVGGVYAGGADGLGLDATMPALAAAVRRGARSLTEAARRLQNATPGDAPVFGTLVGGMGTLVTRLAERSRARVRTGVPVRALSRIAGGWRLELGDAVPAHASADSVFDADAVVLAVPAPAARRLLDGVAPAASAALAGVELASMAVVALAFPPGTELPRASGVLIAEGERVAGGRSLTAKAFTFSSRKWAHFGEGPVVLRGSVGRFGQPRALRATDEELVAALRRDLADLTGLTAEPIDALVTRWGGGLPQYGPGHLRRMATVEEAVSAVDGLAIAGATLHGVGLPACIATADKAARRIAGTLTPSSLPAAGA